MARSSTSSSEAASARPLVNRHFGVTLLALFVAAEIFVRLAPDLGPRFFRIVYGNSLAMMMTVRDRLERSAGSVRVLALGDSLAMTQFQPGLFARMTGLGDGEVFNAAYLGMSFPSQEDLLRSVGMGRLRALQSVLYFVNPRRLCSQERPNTEVLRVGIRPADGPWGEAWRTKRLAPLFDTSRLYGLSRYLMTSAWRSAVEGEPNWDHVEYLGPFGGVTWSGPCDTAASHRYPYPPLESISGERLREMRRVIEFLRKLGAQVWLVPSALHPSVDPFSSSEARSQYDQAIAALARDMDLQYLGASLDGFETVSAGDFCDYGHTSAAGGARYTRHLFEVGGLTLAGARRSWGG